MAIQIDAERKGTVSIAASQKKKLSPFGSMKPWAVVAVVYDDKGVRKRLEGIVCAKDTDVALLKGLIELNSQMHNSSPLKVDGLPRGFIAKVEQDGQFEGWAARGGKNANGKPIEAYEEWKSLVDLLRQGRIMCNSQIHWELDLDRCRKQAKAKVVPFGFDNDELYQNWSDGLVLDDDQAA